MNTVTLVSTLSEALALAQRLARQHFREASVTIEMQGDRIAVRVGC